MVRVVLEKKKWKIRKKKLRRCAGDSLHLDVLKRKVRKKLGAQVKESWVGIFRGFARIVRTSKRRSKMAGCQLVGNPVFYGTERRNCPCQLGEFAGVPLCNPLLKVPLTNISASLSVEGPPDGYRKNVGICLVNPSKKIFTASRIYIPNTWQMPQGGANNGEDLRKAAMRELREETGVTSAEFLAEAPYWMTYDFPIEVKNKLNRKWGTNYKGQAQKWFLFKFTGKEEEINLLGDGSEKPEFQEWSWRLPEQVVEFAVDFKKPVYEQVLKVFSPYFSSDADEEHSAENEPNQEVHKQSKRS